MPETQWFGEHPRRPLVKAGAWAALANGGNALVALCGTVVLSRLLDPSEVGLYTLAFTFYSIPSQVIGPGLTAAAVQAPHLTKQQASNLFWINTGANSGMAILLVVASPLLAAMYDQPSMLWLCPVFGAVLVLEGIATQYRALLHRAMRFDLMAKMQLVVGVVSLSLAIGLAWLGYGVWALVAQVFVGAVLDRIALAVIVPWRPTWFVPGAGIRQLIHFTGGSSLALGIHLLYTQIQTLLMGRFASVSDIGFYNRGQSLLQKPFTQLVGPLQAVLLPAFASRQRDLDDLGVAVYRANAMLFTLLPPLTLWMMVSGRDLASGLLGKAWHPAGDAVFWFAVAATPGIFFGTLYKANEACGRPTWGLGIRLAFLPALLAGIVWAAPRGATAMAAVGAAVEWVSTPVIFWLLVKDGPVPARYFARAIGEGILATSASAAVLWFCKPFLQSSSLPWLVRITFSLGTCYAVGLLAAAAFGYGRAAMREMAVLASRALRTAKAIHA